MQITIRGARLVFDGPRLISVRVGASYVLVREARRIADDRAQYEDYARAFPFVDDPRR